MPKSHELAQMTMTSSPGAVSKYMNDKKSVKRNSISLSYAKHYFNM